MNRFLKIGRVNRLQYLAWGLGLTVLKFCIDWLVATQLFGRRWNPGDYVSWHAGILHLPWDDQRLALTLSAVAVPFIVVGIALTLARLADAQVSPLLVVLFFVPFVNVMMFLVLSIIGSHVSVEPAPNSQTTTSVVGQVTVEHARQQARFWREVTRAVAISATSSLIVAVMSAAVLGSYGVGIFLGMPFLAGLIGALSFNPSSPNIMSRCITAAMLSITVVGVALLALALEGAICLLMAAPIAYPLAFMGGLVGYAIMMPRVRRSADRLIPVLLLAMPLLMAAEAATEPEPTLHTIRTAVFINAPQERVWMNVVEVPPLDEPDEWLFRLGVAYPQNAKIDGHGVGAVRRCNFSTGAFVEPIDIWDAPHRLHFRVTEQPEPMRELSLWNIHPPHLDHYLVSQAGEFELTACPDGRTRLQGTTWYTNRMWPETYWKLWSDWIIGKIHLRVLDHIRTISESPQ